MKAVKFRHLKFRFIFYVLLGILSFSSCKKSSFTNQKLVVEDNNSANIAIQNGNEAERVLQQSPIKTLHRIGNSPNEIIVKVIDKKGVPFNPNIFLRQPKHELQSSVDFLPTISDYGATADFTDSTIVYSYKDFPFPAGAQSHTDFRSYYRIQSEHIEIDGISKKYSTNPSFSFYIDAPGKYELTICLPDVTRK